MSHTRHSSSHAAACLSNEAPKSVCRATDVVAFTSVSLTAGSRDVKNVTSFDPRRLALAHVDGQDLLDVVLHLVEPPVDLDLTITAEYAGASRLADVQVRLPGLGLQRDDLRPERPRGHGVQVTAFQLPVAGDPALLTRPSIAVTTSARPDQFSGTSVHSIPP